LSLRAENNIEEMQSLNAIKEFSAQAWGVMVERVTVKRDGEIEFSFIDGAWSGYRKTAAETWVVSAAVVNFFWKLDLFTMEELRKH